MGAAYRRAGAQHAWTAIKQFAIASRMYRASGDDLKARLSEGFMEAAYAAHVMEFKELGMLTDPRTARP